MEKQIITKFLAEYEITNDKDDYVMHLELSNWAEKNGYRLSKFLKYLQEHCVERDLLNVKNKSYKYEKICAGVKNKTPELMMLAEKQESIAPGKPFDDDQEDAMPLNHLEDDSLKPFDEWFISIKTHRMHHIDDYVPWIQSSHGDEYLIIEQDGHKELVLKSVIKDLLN
jgi:hypothetical protein